MKINSEEIAYCTYFDKNYLIKGLSMCTSLLRHSPSTTLFVLCMDEYTEKIIRSYKLKNLKIIKLSDFEDKELLAIKPTRKFFEYYWTCTPSLPLYIFKHFSQFKYVTYVDADLFFYSSPEIAFEELGDKSILTVEHRYPKGQESRVDTSGRFNVAFQIFKKDKEGISCLKRWRKQCIDWCYYRYEDGKMGDQVYLNEWPDLYKKIVVTNNLGIDAAPWNIKQYGVNSDLAIDKNDLKIESNNREKHVYINHDKLVCYHFHQFQILTESTFELCSGYFLQKPIVEFIYNPYVEDLKKQIKFVKSVDNSFTITPVERSIYQILRNEFIKRFGPLYWNLQMHFIASSSKVIGINALFLIPNEVGGTEYHLRSFVNYLQLLDKMNKYVLFCNKENFDTFELVNSKWKKVYCPVRASNRASRILYEQLVLPFWIWWYKCNVLHSYGYFGPINPPAKHILTIHDANWKDHPENVSLPAGMAAKFLIESCMRNSKKIIADSVFSKTRLSYYFKDYSIKLQVIKAGVDEKFKKIASLKLTNPLKHKRYILCVAAMYPHKRVPYVLDIFEEALKLDPKLHLVLIGNNGKDQAVVLRRITEIKNIVYHRKVSLRMLVSYYKNTKAFILPSVYEGFGFPVYEALLLKAPTFVGEVSMYDTSVQPILNALSWNPKEDAKKIVNIKRSSQEIKVPSYRDNTKELIQLYESL